MPLLRRRRSSSTPTSVASSSHREPERGDKPELNDAARILAAEAARRESLFEQSVEAEKTRDDALTRRFEEALKQASERADHAAQSATSIWTD